MNELRCSYTRYPCYPLPVQTQNTDSLIKLIQQCCVISFVLLVLTIYGCCSATMLCFDVNKVIVIIDDDDGDDDDGACTKWR